MAFTPKTVEEIELKKFRNNPDLMSMYMQGKELLVRSGMINFLRIFSRPFSHDAGANPYISAYRAAVTEGYNKCLDDLVYFEDMYLGAELQKSDVKATFGGLAYAVSRGDLSKEEAEKLNGKIR